jgi:hypothetical protein
VLDIRAVCFALNRPKINPVSDMVGLFSGRGRPGTCEDAPRGRGEQASRPEDTEGERERQRQKKCVCVWEGGGVNTARDRTEIKGGIDLKRTSGLEISYANLQATCV